MAAPVQPVIVIVCPETVAKSPKSKFNSAAVSGLFATVKLHLACGSLHFIKEVVPFVKLEKLATGVTAPTFVPDKSIFCREEQLLNILNITVTAAVLKELRFSDCREVQFWNIPPIPVTAAVLNGLKFSDCRE